MENNQMKWVEIAKHTIIISKLMFFLMTYIVTFKIMICELFQADNVVIDILGNSLICTFAILQSIYLILSLNIEPEPKTISFCMAIFVLLYLLPSVDFLRGVLVAYISCSICTIIILVTCSYNMPSFISRNMPDIITKAYFSWDIKPQLCI